MTIARTPALIAMTAAGVDALSNGRAMLGLGEGLPMTALYLGGMGARKKNFYNDVFASFGYEKEAAEIQELYLTGKKKEAEAAIPCSFIEATTLIGPKGFVREQLAAYRESGVTNVNVSLIGRTTAERVATLERLNESVATL